MRVKPIFAWFDMWIGVFVDTKNGRVYVFPIPCFGLVFYLGNECRGCEKKNERKASTCAYCGFGLNDR